MIKCLAALCLTLCSGLGAQQSLVDANFANWTIATSMTTTLGGYLVIFTNSETSSNFATLTSPLFSYTNSCGAWINPIVSINMTTDTATLTTSAMINQAVRSGYWQVLDAPTGLTPNMGHYFR